MRNLMFLFSEAQPNSATSFLIHLKRNAIPQLPNETFVPSQSAAKLTQLSSQEQHEFRIFVILDGKRVSDWG